MKKAGTLKTLLLSSDCMLSASMVKFSSAWPINICTPGFCPYHAALLMYTLSFLVLMAKDSHIFIFRLNFLTASWLSLACSIGTQNGAFQTKLNVSPSTSAVTSLTSHMNWKVNTLEIFLSLPLTPAAIRELLQFCLANIL